MKTGSGNPHAKRMRCFEFHFIPTLSSLNRMTDFKEIVRRVADWWSLLEAYVHLEFKFWELFPRKDCWCWWIKRWTVVDTFSAKNYNIPMIISILMGIHLKGLGLEGNVSNAHLQALDRFQRILHWEMCVREFATADYLLWTVSELHRQWIFHWQHSLPSPTYILHY